MSGGRVEGKVIYETQSTHKLLAAFSQASMIHVKGDVNEETFNEAYMMHTTTTSTLRDRGLHRNHRGGDDEGERW